MSNILEYMSIGHDVVAFTTKRSLGRDRERLCQMLCIDDSHLVIPHQTHGSRICKVTSSLLTLSTEQVRERLEGIDAVITDEHAVCIGVSTADCIPVLLYDATHHAVAAIHAGWRGTVQRIVQHTIQMMQNEYGTSPADIKAVIGPGICLQNFEVGDEVYKHFEDEGFPMYRIAKRFAKWHIDLWECNRLQLTDMGVKDENIHTEAICTYDNTDILFSARREQTGTVKCGRNFNAIMLKPTNHA